MTFKIGIDIINISRIKGAFDRRGVAFLERYLCASEMLLAFRPFFSKKLCKRPFLDKKLFFKQRLKKKIDFLAHEILKSNNFHIKNFRVETLAGLWAIKEAVAKALGVGISKDLGFKDIWIYKDCKGRPHVKIAKKALKKVAKKLCLKDIKKAKNKKIQNLKDLKILKNTRILKSIAISLSHDNNLAIAVCVVA